MGRPFTATGALRARYSVLIVLATAILIGIAGWVYTNHVQRQADARYAHQQEQADARWCALFALLDPEGAPPTTERGQLVAKAIRDLREDFRCKESP
jgi:hypothetical protein